MPRNFDCPWTGRPCMEGACNYKASGYCVRRERADFASRRHKAQKARLRLPRGPLTAKPKPGRKLSPEMRRTIENLDF